jgi:RNA polymerase-binding transcription factor DksA
MASSKTIPVKNGKAVSASEKNVKQAKPAAHPAVKAANKTEKVSQKPAVTRESVPSAKAFVKLHVPDDNETEFHEAAGKTIQKPSETVKEKTTPENAAPKTEAPPKKKTAAKAETADAALKADAPAKAESKASKADAKTVKIPKTTATGKVPYEPDFTHSVLDAAVEEPQQQVPNLRYSDAELNEFKSLIQRKLDAAKKELAYLQGLITRKDAMGGDNDDGRYMTMEDGSLSMEREQLSQMASRQITFIDHLEKALMRIENKTYGVCRVTGKLIDKARLKAVPHATLSMEAKTNKSRAV